MLTGGIPGVEGVASLLEVDKERVVDVGLPGYMHMYRDGEK